MKNRNLNSSVWKNFLDSAHLRVCEHPCYPTLTGTCWVWLLNLSLSKVGECQPKKEVSSNESNIIEQFRFQMEVAGGATAPRGDRHGSSSVGAPGDGCPLQHIASDSPNKKWDIPKNSPYSCWCHWEKEDVGSKGWSHRASSLRSLI